MPSRNGYNALRNLREWFSNRRSVVLAGIGNPIRKDDFVGVEVIRNLKGEVSENIFLVECETVPESYMNEIVHLHPSHILLIDAAIMNLNPGDCRLVMPEELGVFSTVSSHMLPLRLFCEYISRMITVKIALLLIQPLYTDFGEGLSHEVAVSAERISQMLLEILS